MAFDVAVDEDAQLALEVSTHKTRSAVVKLLAVKVEVFPPTLLPFNFH
jgi:hypothetical protein